MDPELIERLNEQFREMSELLSQQNATMAAQLNAMQSQTNASKASSTAQNNQNNAVNRNSTRIEENNKKQEAYLAAEQQREQQRNEMLANFRGAMNSTVGSLISFKDAVLGTERGFSKYGNAISGLGDAAWDLGKNFGILGGALGGLAKGVGMAANAVLQQTDNMNNFADTFKNMGAVGGITNTRLLEMAQSAGYASQDLQKLSKPIATLGNAIVNIGGTAAEGQKAFMNIINIGEDARKKFNRLGLQIEEVNDAQANYIALQRMSGVAFSASARDQDRLRKSSLEYTENLIELASLTGTDIETIKKKQQIAFQEYQELVTIQKENARIAELRKRGNDADAQAEIARIEARQKSREQVKKETDELFGASMGAQIRDYLRSGGRISETNIGAYQLAGRELEQLRRMYEGGASQEQMSTFMRENLTEAMKQGIGSKSTQLGNAINVLDPREAEELGAQFGLDRELMIALAGRDVSKAKEAEKGVEKAGKEGFDKAADSRAALTELEIKAKVEFDKLLLSINPLTNGFNAGTAAAIALAAAATGAAIALGRMAMQARMGGGPGAMGGSDIAGGGGKGAKSGGLKQNSSGRWIKENGKFATAAEIAEHQASKTGKLAKAGRILGKAGGLLGRLAVPLTIAGSLYEGYTGYQEANEAEKAGQITAAQAKQKKGEAIGGAVGGGVGGLAGGALAGAAIGSVIPVVGTAIGGIIGGALGYYLGNKAGSAIGGLVSAPGKEEAAANAKAAPATPTANAEAPIPEQTVNQFNSAVKSFGSLITSFAKTVTAFAVTTKAYAITTKAYAKSTTKFAEAVNHYSKLTYSPHGSPLNAKVATTEKKIDRRSKLDDLVGNTVINSEDLLDPFERFQLSLEESTNQMKFLREEEIKRHRFNDISMRQFRQSLDDASEKLSTLVGTPPPGGGADGGSTAPPDQYGSPAGKVVDAGKGYTTVEYEDGRVEKRTGSRNWRNNNPGNLEYGNFARSHGAIGSDGRFAVFPTYEQGRAAKEALLFEGSGYRGLTVGQAITRYAPPSENNTGRYIRTITRAIGRSADTPLSDLTAEQRTAMMNAMEQVEGFRAGRVEVLREGTGTPGAVAAKEGDFTTISAQGKSAKVAKEVAPKFQALLNQMTKRGYPIRTLSGFSDRDVRGEPGTKSAHSRGWAIDVNADENPMGSRLVTDIPKDIVQFARSQGLGWGGNWRSKKDAMHFSAQSNEGGYLRAKKGGVFDGPESGYPVEMHGSEMIAPLNTNSILMKLAKTPADNEAATKITSPAPSIEKEAIEKIYSMNSEMMDAMLSKLDDMVNAIIDGNDTRDRILKNSQA